MTEHFTDDELRAAYEALPRRSTAHTTECPDQEALLTAVRGVGPEEERLRVLDHALRCPACQPELALLHAITRAGTRAEPAARRPLWLRMAPLAAAATVVIALGIFTLTSRNGTDVITRNGATGEPALVAPAANDEIAAGRVSFVWRPVPGALSYTLEVAAADGSILFMTRTADTTTVAELTTLTRGQNRWWVRAHMNDATERRSETRLLPTR